MALNANILLYDEPRKLNTKASEEYVHVRFSYPDVHKNGTVGFLLNIAEQGFRFRLRIIKPLRSI